MENSLPQDEIRSTAKVIPGVIKERFRMALGARDGWQCHYCSKPLDDELVRRQQLAINLARHLEDALLHPPYLLEPATLDHKIPVSAGGLHTMDNLVLCCTNCNTKKHATSYAAFLARRQQS